MGCFRLAGCFLLLLSIGPILLVLLSLYLTFGVGAGQCGGGREIVYDPILSREYLERWNGFQRRAFLGEPASITVTESEATSRTRDFLDSTNAPVSDVRVCFTDDGGDVNGTVDAPLLPDVDVRVKGTADLRAGSPDIDIDSIKIGGMPSFLTRPFHGLVTRIIDDQASQIYISQRIAVETREGEATLTNLP